MNPREFLSIGRKKVGTGQPVYVVAEAGSNHNRDWNTARELVEAAARAGADAVKFQLFQADRLYPPNCGVVPTPAGPVDFFKALQKSEIPGEWLPALKKLAESRGLAFLCSPFDEGAARALGRLGIQAFKVASPELNHVPLLETLAKTGRPLICSTGISTLGDIEEALAAIRAANPRSAVALLHCVSSYPCPSAQANVRAVETLRRAFGVPVGFSDHTLDEDIAPLCSLAMGACLIEKHFTLSRSSAGLDHSFALEPEGLARMIGNLRKLERVPAGSRLAALRKRFGQKRVESVLGHGRKEIMPAEKALYPCDKRSLHALRAIPAGERLTPGNIRVLRSERNLRPGLAPRYWKTVLGRRVTRALRQGEGLLWDNLLSRKP